VTDVGDCHQENLWKRWLLCR